MELENIQTANAEIKRLYALIYLQEKIVRDNIETIKSQSEFKIGDKVIVGEGYKGIIEYEHICFVSAIMLFSDTKDGNVYYRFNKPKKDGTMSKFRQEIIDHVISIKIFQLGGLNNE